MSLDSSLTGFGPNLELHYRIASDYHPDAHLIGSRTALKGIELFSDGIPREEPQDFEVPSRDAHLPSWVFVDSRGVLQGLLHIARRFEYCRDIIVLISGQTPEWYRQYLSDRKYTYYVAGNDQVDLRGALGILSESCGMRTILTDTGRILGNALLVEGLVSEISLLVHPVIVGEGSYPMFGDTLKDQTLRLKQAHVLDGGYVWMIYDVIA